MDDSSREEMLTHSIAIINIVHKRGDLRRGEMLQFIREILRGDG